MNLHARLKRFFAPNSVLFQLLSRSLLLMAILLLVIGLFQYVLMRSFIYQNKAATMQSQILATPPEVWAQLANDVTNKTPAVRPNRLHFFAPDSSIALFDSAGNYTVLYNSPLQAGATPKLATQVYENAMHGKAKLNFSIANTTGGQQLLVLQPIIMRGYLLGVLQVGVSSNPLRAVLLRQLLTFLIIALLALLGGMLAFVPVLRKTLVPLSQMVDKVGQIDAGNLAERLPDQQGQMEVDRLAVSFNGMLERLEASFAAEKEAKEQMRRFVADASHELRTPLTSIHGFLEVLFRGAMYQPEMLQKSLKSMYAESERMKKLVQDLLLLAKLDRSPNIQLSEGRLDDLVTEMEQQLRMLAGSRIITFSLAAPVTCFFDADKMKQVVLNLFNNAVQHTDPTRGSIELTLLTAKDGVTLTVKDNGSGIPAEHLPYLFERFYRIDSSRTRKYGGAGLGLAITKSIVELHGGAISAESSAGEGSSFYVFLPFRPKTDQG
ncbi:MAG: ATP-binding protein [Peptococcaceae bacterium]|nr:ATP-binding protein [Peptococcaceae bacterium]